jgi:hypothetical protein
MANTFNLGNGNWAQKTEKLLAYNAENDNYKPLPFDFDRGSTATVVNKDGLIETVGADEPRIDFLNNTNGHLLLEPSRTNKMPSSEDFNGADWNRASLTINSDDAISPYGTSTADKITFTGNGSLRTWNTFTFTDAYTYSIFVKKGNSRYVTLRSFAFTTSAVIGFDLDTVTSETGGVIEQYPNDWFRLSISKDISSDADKNGYFYFYLPNNLGSTTSVSGNYAYIFGNQIEEGSYATSYIPTSGSTATRSADVCNNAGNSTVFNDSEGVLYAEIAALHNTGDDRWIAISDGGYSNQIKFAFSDEANKIRIYATGSSTIDQEFTISDNKLYKKIALSYSDTSDELNLYVNGFVIYTTTSIPNFSGLDVIAFDNGAGVADFYGKVKDLKVYNTALSDSELQALTS